MAIWNRLLMRSIDLKRTIRERKKSTHSSILEWRLKVSIRTHMLSGVIWTHLQKAQSSGTWLHPLINWRMASRLMIICVTDWRNINLITSKLLPLSRLEEDGFKVSTTSEGDEGSPDSDNESNYCQCITNERVKSFNYLITIYRTPCWGYGNDKDSPFSRKGRWKSNQKRRGLL